MHSETIPPCTQTSIGDDVSISVMPISPGQLSLVLIVPCEQQTTTSGDLFGGESVATHDYLEETKRKRCLTSPPDG